MLTNLFIFLAFYSSDLNDNQRIDSDGMIERTYYLQQYHQEDQLSFSEAFRAARKELGVGKIFIWNDRYFTTNFYYETVIVVADEVVDINKEDKTYASEEKLGDIIAVRSYKDSDKYEINYTFLNKIVKWYYKNFLIWVAASIIAESELLGFQPNIFLALFE